MKKNKYTANRPAPASAAGPCPTICKSSRMPWHWKLPSTIAQPNHPRDFVPGYLGDMGPGGGGYSCIMTVWACAMQKPPIFSALAAPKDYFFDLCHSKRPPFKKYCSPFPAWADRKNLYFKKYMFLWYFFLAPNSPVFSMRGRSERPPFSVKGRSLSPSFLNLCGTYIPISYLSTRPPSPCTHPRTWVPALLMLKNWKLEQDNASI